MTPVVPTNVAILGTGGFALELATLILQHGGQVAGFTGPSPDCPLPAAWLGDDDCLPTVAANIAVLAAVGRPALRQRLLERAAAAGHPLARFVHPAACVAESAFVGEGCMVYPNSTIHALVRLERGVLVNSNVSIGHETSIGPFSNLGPGSSLGGRTHLGTRVIVGIGASLIERLEIADDVTIGAGAAVVRSIPATGTWVGVPARPLGEHK